MSEMFPGRIPGYYDGYDTLPPDEQADEDALIFATADNDHATYEANLTAGDPLPESKLSFSVHPDNPERFSLIQSDEELGEPPIDPVEATAWVKGYFAARLREQQTSHRLTIDDLRNNRRDPLTNLLDRHSFSVQAEQLLHAPVERRGRGRRQQPRHSFVLLDLDNFKQVNDRLGHPTGDEVLQGVAAALTASVQRDTDLVARFGGEEFVILLNDMSPAKMRGFMNKLRAAIASVRVEGLDWPITASIGVAPLPHGSSREDIEGAYRRADAAAILAKNSGKDNVALLTRRGGVELLYPIQMQSPDED